MEVAPGKGKRYHDLLYRFDGVEEGSHNIMKSLRTTCFLEAAMAEERGKGQSGDLTQIDVLEALTSHQRTCHRQAASLRALNDSAMTLSAPQDTRSSVCFEVFAAVEQVLAGFPPLVPAQLTQASTPVAPNATQTRPAATASTPPVAPIVRSGPQVSSSRLPSRPSPAHPVQPAASTLPPSSRQPAPIPPYRPNQGSSVADGSGGFGAGRGGGAAPSPSAPAAAGKRPIFSTAGEMRNRGDAGRKRPLDGGRESEVQWGSASRRQDDARGWPDSGASNSSLGPSYEQFNQHQDRCQQQPSFQPTMRRGNDSGFLTSRLMGSSNDNDHSQQKDIEGTNIPGTSTAVRRPFVPPTRVGADGQQQGGGGGRGRGIGGAPGTARAMVNRALVGPPQGSGDVRRTQNGGGGGGGGEELKEGEMPEKLKGCDPVLVERIENDIIDRGDPITFEDIAGLAFAKKCVMELVCWPMARPDIFTGLRALPKGLLLFGPPGTGKTLIGKAIACQSGATFFNISASSLTSKWIGEGEKLVRTLFAVAAHHQPSIIFIDEVDSLLCQRSSEENESSRRLKTEFLVQLDGAGTSSEDRVLVIGATNRPQELDEAARRRFVKRLYIPLPEAEARHALVSLLLRKNPHSLMAEEVDEVVSRTAGFSGADIRALCTEAAMGPIRDMATDISNVSVADVPPIRHSHFLQALSSIRPSVSEKDLGCLRQWNAEFGTFPRASENPIS